MTDHSVEYTAHITPSTPLLPALRSWELYLADQGRSVYTIKAFLGDVQLLANYLAPDRSLGSITTRDLNAFLDWMQTGRGIPCSPKSLARRITSIKAFFRWLLKGGAIPHDPAEKVLQKSVISPLPEVLTPQELKKVLDVADAHRTARKPDARPYTLVALLLATGIKKGECLTLHINHVDLQSESGPFVFIRYANNRNRYKERKIFLPDAWVAAYQEYQAQYKPTDTVFPWSPRRLEYLLEDLGQEADLSKHLSFDMCRWTCVLTDWKSGMDQEKIRQKMGVSKIQWREIGLKLQQLSAETTPRK